MTLGLVLIAASGILWVCLRPAPVDIISRKTLNEMQYERGKR